MGFRCIPSKTCRLMAVATKMGLFSTRPVHPSCPQNIGLLATVTLLEFAALWFPINAAPPHARLARSGRLKHQDGIREEAWVRREEGGRRT